jgi:hypothetical protein
MAGHHFATWIEILPFEGIGVCRISVKLTL